MSTAIATFTNEVASLQGRHPGMSYSNAWNRTAVLRADLIAQMGGERAERRRQECIRLGLPHFANTIPEPPAFAVVPPQFFAPLGLAPGVDPEIFRIAWKANGGQLVPRNSRAILDAICSHLQKKNRWNYPAALKYCQQHFPVLVGEMKHPEIKLP